MESPPQPKSVRDMTADERRRLLTRRQPNADTAPGMEIGGRTAGRRAIAVVGRLLAFAALATLFVVMFYRFTASWRVAMIVVAAMGGYMLLVGRLVEGRADRID